MTNAEKAQGEVEIEVLGEKRKLVFGTLAFCLLEEVTGIDVLAGDLWKSLNTTVTSALLWAGLKVGGLDMSLEDFRKKVPLNQLRELRSAITSGMERATPTEKKSENETETAPATNESPPTGSNSGQSEDSTSA